MRSGILAFILVAAVAGVPARQVQADPTSGVDAELFRPSFDTTGVFSLEGARLMPRRDLSFKILLGYAQKPLNVAVPGIGGDTDVADPNVDAVLKYAVVLDLDFGFTLTKKLSIGFGTAVYRSDTDVGYGKRGRYAPAENDRIPSTGMLALRPFSNIDTATGFVGELSGPLDVRVGAKYSLLAGKKSALAVLGIVHLPFGEDEMFLGDANFVLEPRVAWDFRPSPLKSTRIVVNGGVRFRERTALESVLPDQMDQPKVVLDVGSEVVAGAGAMFELSPRLMVGGEVVGFVPLPTSVGYGNCRRSDGRACSTITDDDYFGKTKAGDLAMYGMAGVGFRASGSLTFDLLGGAAPLGARGDDFRVTLGVVWSPQAEATARIGAGDKDGDGIPDVSDVCSDEPEDRDGYQDDDGCPDLDNDGDGIADATDSCVDEPEDKDSFQDEDGCPERDNDADGIQDVADRCPDEKEDVDGYEDDDGCPDEDNDGDGFADKNDKCPNDPETVNGVDDDDGCPDVRAQTGPQEAGDRIDLRGNKVEFAGNTANPTSATRVILGQVASLIKDRNLTIRVEVHVPLGTRSKNARTIARQKQKDKDLSQRRAQAILEYLRAQGVPISQLQAVGLGSDRPLGSNPPEDSINERVDFIKAQQRTP